MHNRNPIPTVDATIAAGEAKGHFVIESKPGDRTRVVFDIEAPTHEFDELARVGVPVLMQLMTMKLEQEARAENEQLERVAREAAEAELERIMRGSRSEDGDGDDGKAA